jgi:hypothetical protein
LSPINIGLVVFAFVFGGALLGMFLRGALPTDAGENILQQPLHRLAAPASGVLGCGKIRLR